MSDIAAEVQSADSDQETMPAMSFLEHLDELRKRIFHSLVSVGVGAVPDSAQDKDIPVEIVTDYTLAPHDDFVRMVTTIKDDDHHTLEMYGTPPSGKKEMKMMTIEYSRK